MIESHAVLLLRRGQLLWLLLFWTATVTAAAPGTGLTGGQDLLYLNNKLAGVVHDPAGGYATQLILLQPERGFWVGKFPSELQFEPLQIGFGSAMSRAWYEWLSAQLAGPTQPGNIALLRLDSRGAAVRQLTLAANLQSLTFPEFDRSRPDSGGPLILRAQLQGRAAPVPVFGNRIELPAESAVQASSKTVLLQNMVLNIQGMEKATRQAVYVGSLNVQRRATTGSQQRQSDIIGSQPFVASNLIVRVPESVAGPLYGWYEKAVVQGKPSELPGVMEYRNQDMSVVVASVDLINIGMLRLSPRSQEGREALVEVELYVEEVVPHLENLAP